MNTRTGWTVEPESWPPILKMDVKVTAAGVAGSVTMVSVVPGTVAVLAPFVKVSSTDDAPVGVPVEIKTTTSVALATVHMAAVPLEGAAPTLAVHAKPEMKFVPVTVMALPTCAAVGAMDVAVGSAVTVSVVPAAVAVLAPFVKVSSTDDATVGVVAPITTVTSVALTYVHDEA